VRLCTSCYCAAFVLFVSSSTAVPAQTSSTGALTGIITDRTGAVISGATVAVTNNDTGQKRTARTGVDGSYTLSLLPPGSYMAQFSAARFKTAEIGAVRINITETPVLDEVLEVGPQREQVTVEGDVEPLQTASSSLGNVVSGSQVSGLPLTTRNYTQIIGLVAGVNASVSNASAVGNGSQDFSVNGMDPTHNNFQMDGVSITPLGAGSPEQGFYSGIGIPGPDAVSEFKIQTSLYDASYGRNPGANVNVVTKSGTNVWHGTAFEFFRNTALDANSFFQNRIGGGKQPLNQNQFGGVLGGPIKKDQLFIFGSYQGTRQKNAVDPTGNSTGATLPPIPGGDRNGSGFQSALGQVFCNNPTYSKEIGLGGVQVACDGSNVNPVALNILRLKNSNGTYYIPGSTTGTYSTATFIDPDIYSEEQYLLNVDYLVSSRNTIATRYFYSHEHQSQGFNCLIMANACLPGAGQNDHFNNTAAVLRLTSLLTTSLVNEAHISFQRDESSLGTKQQFTNSGVGITPVTPQINLLAPLTVLGEFDSGGSTEPNFDVSNQFQWGDQVSWTRGRHTIRAGGEFEHIQWPWVFQGISKGWLLFETFPDFLLGLPACAPNTFPNSCNASDPGSTNGTPLSNIIATVLAVRTPPGGIVHGYRVDDANAFVQDDFKVTGRLTLNMGLRWEFDGYPTDKYGNLTNIWLSQIESSLVSGTSSATGTYAGFVVPANYRGPLPSGIRRNSRNDPTRTGTPWNNLAPRFGFAWQPIADHKLVVRGGYGYFFDRVNANSVIHAVEQSPPYSLTLDNSGPALGYASLANPYPDQQLGWGDTRWVNFQTGASSNLNYPFMSENFKTPLVQSYNLSVQYQFLPKWVIEIGYAGSHGIHLVDSGRQVNLAQLASVSHPINGITTNTVENESLRVPFLGFAPNGLQESASDGDMKYDSLLITLRKQFSRDLQIQAAYTWARAFTDLQANGASTGVTNGVNLDSNNPSDARQQYGISSGYRPERLIVNYTWDLPYKSQNGFTGKLLGGWSLTGVTTVQSGQPLTVFDSRGGSIYCGSCQASFSNVESRAQLAPGATNSDVPTHGGVESRLGGISGGPGYITAAAFGPLPTISDGTGFGDSGIGILRGPDQVNFDTAAVKATRVGGLREHATLQFRAEFFNIFNHPQFANPVSTDVSQPNFGWITDTSVNPRLVQLALKYIF
jgi:hypothetical protein